MNEQQALTRVVEAIERIACALEAMAKQQGEFLATMPAEEETFTVPEGMTITPIVVRGDQPGSDDVLPTHAYDAACACPACWAERRRLKR